VSRAVWLISSWLQSKRQVTLWLGHSQAWLKVSLGPDRAESKIELGLGRWQTKLRVVLGQQHPKPVAQRHLVLGLLPLGCSPSAMWHLSCLYF